MQKKQVRGAEATPHSDSSKRKSNVQGDIGTIHNKVLMVLTERPRTRSSDRALITDFYEKFYGVVNEPFWQVMEDGDLPSFETITRCRRKIQETHPELRAATEVESERQRLQEDFKEYANGGAIA